MGRLDSPLRVTDRISPLLEGETVTSSSSCDELSRDSRKWIYPEEHVSEFEGARGGSSWMPDPSRIMGSLYRAGLLARHTEQMR
ncbi:hypothetical protein A2U01_0060185 [Trifolium medium]|uniref:Uncharacterized protein n=1 Tax=Trifolium medium TaxID=97028 RepID=A0A392RTQ9_9FABA|nr:hypothetical protein [Trifolium medium]